MAEADDINRENAKKLEADKRAGARQRAVEEFDDLKPRTDRLGAFINGPEYNNVSDHHKGLLAAQFAGMRAYLQALQIRIKDWDL